ncbi:hypothetical protein [Streptomyces sp. NPDC047990]|uniref:hypothetical protein n=1 Tax=Streptomyces sp. NPDC047990 TaxID=3365496 RepID=UPI0037202378
MHDALTALHPPRAPYADRLLKIFDLRGDLAAVKTDGSFEQADSLKTTFPGAPARPAGAARC